MHDNFFVKPTPENAPEVQRELMSAMAVGDRQAFEQLYRLTSPGYSPSHTHVAATCLGRRSVARQLYHRVEPGCLV